MKLAHAALAAIAGASWCVGLFAQRTADFGFGDDDSPTNVKAEFYWSRLAYSSNMASIGGIRASRLVQIPGRATTRKRTASF